MEEHQEKISESNGLNVDVTSKKIISGKKKEKKILDGPKSNLPSVKSKSDEVLANAEVIESCGNKLSGLSLNGPSKLTNGIENEHFASTNCCSVGELNSKKLTSQIEGSVDVSEVRKDCEVSSLPDDKKADNKQSFVIERSFNEDTSIDGGNNLHNPILQTDSTSIDATSPADQAAASALSSDAKEDLNKISLNEIVYVSYESELQMPDIMRLIQKDLSEPYSIYTYRYFIHNWPQLCFLAMDESTCVGAIVCKLDMHRKVVKRGYIAMLAVDEKYRKRKIGSNLVLKAIRAMVADGADEVVLETEITNKPALRLYENLGFVRDKRLFRYYLNGVDALRLKLWLR